MNKGANKNSTKNLILIILIIAVIGALAWYFLAGQNLVAPTGATSGSEMITKYSGSLKNLEKILKFYQSDLLKQSIFNNFKSFVKLPLELGRVGKANPFAAPSTPEELLLKRPVSPKNP